MKYLLPLPVLLLAGCQMLSYNPPADGDTATVTFTSDNVSAQPVVCVPDKGFRATSQSLARKPFGSDAFNDLLSTMKKAEQVTTTVIANPATRIGVQINRPKNADGGAGDRERCQVAVQFDAEPGASYQAHFTYSNGQCGLEVQGENGAQADAVPVDWKCPK